MALGLNYAVKYSSIVDERFTLGSLTAGITNQNFDWEGVNTVNVFSRELATLGNYTMSGTSRYGTPADLQNDTQSMVLTQDKAFTYIIDRKTADSTMGTMEAGATLAENIDNVVIPAIDKYRIANIVAAAPAAGSVSAANHVISAAVSASNAYSEFLKAQEVLDDDKAPIGGRVAVVTPAFYNFLKLDNNFIKASDIGQGMLINGQVGEVDGVAIVRVPTSYMPTKTDFFITNPVAAPAPIKFAEYRIHENPPGISGWLVEARLYYDCFVLNNKADAIAVHTHP